MRGDTSCRKNEQGFILITTLILLMLLLVLGLSATTTSNIEMQIAGNDKTYNMAFFHADAGIYASPKVISSAILEGANPPASSYDAAKLSFTSSLYNEIMGFSPDAVTNPLNDPEITLTLDGRNVRVNVQRTGQKILAGGGAEFASGASGIGSGSTGGVAILFDVNSVGQAPNSAKSDLLAEYRKVPGTAGGL